MSLGEPVSSDGKRLYPHQGDAARDARLASPSFQRNAPPILAELAPILTGRTGPALEIGAGTGQHAASFALAFPGLDWWPSDPDADHRASIDAWAAAHNLPPRALDLDAAGDWLAQPEVAALGALSLVYSGNVIHISPWTVAEGILRGAGQALAPNGLLIFYGPFTEGGRHTGDGNAAFDADLKRRNPDWGIRDVETLRDLGQKHGLIFDRLIAMPANNRLLVLRRA